MNAKILATGTLALALSACAPPVVFIPNSMATGQVTLHTCPGPTWPQTGCKVSPMQGIRMTLTSASGSFEARTDRDGRYSIKLPPGNYRVTIVAGDWRWQAAPLTMVAGKTATANYQATTLLD